MRHHHSGRRGRLLDSQENHFFTGVFVADNEIQPTEVKITVRPNGSLRIEGPVRLLDANGGEWDLTGKPAFSLCRCGQSSNKPFCDGTHAKCGFESVVVAPSRAETTQS